jgi:hypothetical protein
MLVDVVKEAEGREFAVLAAMKLSIIQYWAT